MRNICLFLNLFVCLFAKGQTVFTSAPFTQKHMVSNTALSTVSIKPNFDDSDVHRFNSTLIKTVPPTFYYNSIGFFCQKELQIEKAVKFPVKFRLGSVRYTDQMEGKGKEILFFDKRK